MIHFEQESDRELFVDALEFAQKQVKGLIERQPDFYPMYTQNGKWKHDGPKWTHWCDGFFPGQMWLFRRFNASRKKEKETKYWMEQAIRYSEPLEPRQMDRDVHDLGFIFMSTYHRWYKVTGDKRLNDVLIQAGKTLSMRFKEKGQYLRSFVSDDSLFIDIMMNVGITLWAARETNDETLRQIGIEHCRTTQQTLVRPDGGTAHEGIFDVTTGAFQRQSTHQGFAAQSTWTRGIAWAIYGFTAAHRLSGVPEFLATAQLCADCYLRRAPTGLVPPWDFDAPSPVIYDSSAAAITASGLFDLCEQVHDRDTKAHYRNAALTMLQTLCTDQFLALNTPGWEGILLHGVYHLHKNLGVDESVAWGDHFFVEALVKASQTRA